MKGFISKALTVLITTSFVLPYCVITAGAAVIERDSALIFKEGTLYIGGLSATTEIANSIPGWSVADGGKTLILDGLNYRALKYGAATEPLGATGGLFIEDPNLEKIILHGDNSITTEGSTGINTRYPLTIEGDGTLYTEGRTYGIRVNPDKKLTIKGDVNVTAKGGNYGMVFNNFRMESGTLTAIGGQRGIYMGEWYNPSGEQGKVLQFFMTGGTIYAKGESDTAFMFYTPWYIIPTGGWAYEDPLTFDDTLECMGKDANGDYIIVGEARKNPKRDGGDFGDIMLAGTDTPLKDVRFTVKPIKKFTSVNDNTTANNFSVENQSNLDEVFDRVVTTSDMSGENVVTLSLNVSDINAQTVETDAIKSIADKGNEVYFFDVTLVKSINDGNATTDTTLTNTSIPVEVHIALTGDLAGKSYYKVYRYHNGVAEQISNDTSKTEHYVVDIARSEIIIHTMKFSTYAIFGNDTTIDDINDNEDMDVQAKITDSSIGIYKVDISWGAMAFEWDSSDKTYDPDTHTWISNGNGNWTAVSHDGVNNKISCANHSNGSLIASFDIAGTLNGVNYDVLTTNEETGTAAVNMPLAKVPNELANAPEIEAYLRLSGEPDGNALSRLNTLTTGEWLKIAVITVTLEPDILDLDKTPKN